MGPAPDVTGGLLNESLSNILDAAIDAAVAITFGLSCDFPKSD